jgi:hypothetical protein
MATPEVGLEGVNVVLRGHFNPAIVTHGWLLAQKLLSVEDFGNTRPNLITPEVSNFTTPWFTCQVTSDALQLSTTEPPEMEPLRDMAVGILKTLPHVPVGVMGINHDFHFKVGDLDEWHAIGDALAPKEPWDGILTLPGTMRLVLLAARTDEQAGRLQVTIEPSTRVGPFGVYVAVNDHYSLRPAVEQPSTREQMWELGTSEQEQVVPSADKNELAVELLGSKWATSYENAQAVLQRVLSLRKVRA